MTSSKKSFFLGVFLCLGFVAITFILFSAYNEFRKKNQVQSKIDELRAEAEKITQENNFIQEKIAYLQTQDYQGLEAKDKLNLQSPGENVVVIKPSVIKNTNEDANNIASQEVGDVDMPDKSPNWLRWYNYFFK